MDDLYSVETYLKDRHKMFVGFYNCEGFQEEILSDMAHIQALAKAVEEFKEEERSNVQQG